MRRMSAQKKEWLTGRIACLTTIIIYKWMLTVDCRAWERSSRLDCCMVMDARQTCQCLPGVRQPWAGKIYNARLLKNLE